MHTEVNRFSTATVLSFLGSVASLVAAVITIRSGYSFESWVSPVVIPYWVGVAVAILIILLLIVPLLLHIKFRKAESRNSNLSLQLESVKEQNKRDLIRLHKSIEEVMNKYFVFDWRIQRLRKKLLLRDAPICLDDFDSMLQTTLNDIYDVFTEYLGAPIHVCLKCVWLDENNEIKVTTRLRDDNSPIRLLDSSEIKWFTYHESSAMEELIDKLKQYFLKNGITADCGFKNPKPFYLDHYDATLCVAVRLDVKNADKASLSPRNPKLTFGSQGNCYGFLCLDGKGVKFDMHCVNMLLNMQRHLYLMLQHDPLRNFDPNQNDRHSESEMSTR